MDQPTNTHDQVATKRITQINLEGPWNSSSHGNDAEVPDTTLNLAANDGLSTVPEKRKRLEVDAAEFAVEIAHEKHLPSKRHRIRKDSHRPVHKKTQTSLENNFTLNEESPVKSLTLSTDQTGNVTSMTRRQPQIEDSVPYNEKHSASTTGSLQERKRTGMRKRKQSDV
ncbi:MAG: hypothetical protein MMC23_007375 [Stictis urceolatum]|nr:hypothetical protein [Stictis urceolata]